MSCNDVTTSNNFFARHHHAPPPHHTEICFDLNVPDKRHLCFARVHALNENVNKKTKGGYGHNTSVDHRLPGPQRLLLLLQFTRGKFLIYNNT